MKNHELKKQEPKEGRERERERETGYRKRFFIKKTMEISKVTRQQHFLAIY